MMPAYLNRRLPSFRMTSTRWRRPSAWVPIVFLLLAVSSLISSDMVRADSKHVDEITIDGTITPVMAHYLHRAIKDAEDDGANALVVKLDTPGGLSSAMDDMTRAILESKVPVVVYVAPRGARAAS